MSGTLPKPEGDKAKQKEKEEPGNKEIKDNTVVTLPPLSENDARSVPELNGDEAEEETEEEEEVEEEEEEEEQLPPGWSKEIDADDPEVPFYWNVRLGLVSFSPYTSLEIARLKQQDGSIHSQPQTARSNESIPSTTRTQKTTGGATTDRKNNRGVDEFEKLLRDQMFNRQLKEVLQIGDKELLRAVIVRYEDSKPPSDRQKNDVADEKDDGCQESKELLKTIDYYYHKLRELVLRGHWLQSLSPETREGGTGRGQRGGGARGTGAGRGRGAGLTPREMREARFYRLMDKFDRLTSTRQEQQHLQQVEYADRWTTAAEEGEDALRIVNEIDSLLLKLRPKIDSRKPKPDRTKGPIKGAPKRNPTEEEIEAEHKLQVLRRVRHFLHQQMEYLDQLGQALRPRDTSLPILAMDKKTMAEIRSYSSPKPIVHKVMQAALLLLGHDEATTADWRYCKSACVPDGRDGLNRRLMGLNVADIHPFIVERSWKILRRIRLEDIQKASPGAATFYVWASSVLRIRDHSIDDDVLEGESNDEKMTQQEIVRREQDVLREPVTSRDDYGYDEYYDERPPYPDTIYNI